MGSRLVKSNINSHDKETSKTLRDINAGLCLISKPMVERRKCSFMMGRYNLVEHKRSYIMCHATCTMQPFYCYSIIVSVALCGWCLEVAAIKSPSAIVKNVAATGNTQYS